jgi:hypothetical protein
MQGLVTAVVLGRGVAHNVANFMLPTLIQQF